MSHDAFEGDLVRILDQGGPNPSEGSSELVSLRAEVQAMARQLSQQSSEVSCLSVDSPV